MFDWDAIGIGVKQVLNFLSSLTSIPIPKLGIQVPKQTLRILLFVLYRNELLLFYKKKFQ